MRVVPAEEELLLTAESVTIEYTVDNQQLRAVSNASVAVGRGETISLVGDSGSGKSTLVLGLLGLARPGGRIVGGSIRFGGTELVGASDRILRRVRGGEIGLITQHPKAAFNPLTRVGEQIAQMLKIHGKERARGRIRERAIELFETVGINDAERRLRAYPHELSGGMAQRAMIAMALAGEPKVLLADEPTSGLDATLQAQILDDLKRTARENGLSLVLVTHDLGIVANYADRVYLMNAGEVVEHSGVEEFFGCPVHPAGAAMLAAQRGIVDPSLRLAGLPVDRRSLPDGCWLHPRCPFMDPASGCTTEHPPLEEIAPDREVRCHRWRQVAAATADRLGSAARV